MDLFEATATIFFFTATSDGKVDSRELDVIEAWFADRQVPGDRLGEKLIELAGRYQNADPLTILGDAGDAAVTILKLAPAVARRDLLLGLLRTVLADGTLHPAEKNVFELLAATWGCDPVDVLREHPDAKR